MPNAEAAPILSNCFEIISGIQILVEACGNCGKKSSDDRVKLKSCTTYRLVKYCSMDCHRAHHKQHEGGSKKCANGSGTALAGHFKSATPSPIFYYYCRTIGFGLLTAVG